MTAKNRTSFFNTGLPLIGGSGRVKRRLHIRVPTQVAKAGGSGSGAAYFMRGWDSGSGGRWVTWGPNSFVQTAPATTDTTPHYTGTLSAIHIVSGP